MSYLAIVDLGSNSLRVVVEEIHDDGTHDEIMREKQDTRIAQGMGEELLLKEEPIMRTIRALKAFQKLYAHYQPLTVKAITTAAVRMAHNQAMFLSRVAQETGIMFEVLTGDQEAYYDYLGVVTTLDVQNATILDTGGASVELIPVAGGRHLATVSLPFGAVSLSERFHLENQAQLNDISAACGYILSQYATLPWLAHQKGLPVILLGGANRSLARMSRQQFGEENIEQIHGYELPFETVELIFDALCQLSRYERENIVGLEKSRADIIVSGLLPLVNLMRTLQSPKVIFSESGVREGIIAELLSYRHE
ncbi:Ppx/GppA phosphatase family protein [Leuconostoc fallax]|mgnify:CR=1 FL=1|uniref:Ppx/GppA phosphatase N-terminal domain-containing protein n=1 Tax=Leuconostoc fallax TaxID=1251 RepID=A0A4R5NAI5_9LACO|nr:exopolyphosphatase [Leuconostoc fallax]MBU7454951.1 exopolyphosphatase [Leuconostoc fallax]MCO6183227.1 exopolyphosphatase [Leuconostoc fallax]TDG69516.1 hypothetical protein C5L23_000978 [Leuconostoc fallax]